MDPDTSKPPRATLRRNSVWVMLLMLGLMMFVLVGFRIPLYDRVLMFEAMQRLDANPQLPEISAHEVGVCMIVTREDATHRVHEALRRVRGLYPFAPVFVHSPSAAHQTVVHEWGGAFSVYDPKLNVSTVMNCLESAARQTNTTMFINERTLLLRKPIVSIPLGTVGLVGYHDQLPLSDTQRNACGSGVQEPSIVPAGSVLASEWIRSVTRDMIDVVGTWDRGLSHLVWCTGNRVAVDARIMRDASPRHRRHRHDLHTVLQEAGDGRITFLKI